MTKIETKKIVLYIIIVGVLFLIPIYTIIVNTSTLKDGKEILFRVEAFDPYDVFRGNYLDISFSENYARSGSTFDAEYGDRCFVTIKEDESGFAYFDKMTKNRPENTEAYFETRSYYGGRIETPTRYYMNENKSLVAEEIYNENIDNTYIKVRVKNGKMVIVGVYVDDKLIDTIEK